MHLEQDETLIVGQLRFRVLETPGHTEDSICLVVGDRVLTGDTLLIGGTGRTDLPTGDPDAKITKMKDGRTHLAHKQEHAVDMDTGAVVAVTVQGATEGDTSTIEGTLEAAEQNLEAAREHAGDESQMADQAEEAVADKGDHSKAVILALRLAGWRTYIAEPRRGRQQWEGQHEEREAVYGNRRRMGGDHGKALMRLRGELIERSFAHALPAPRS